MLGLVLAVLFSGETPSAAVATEVATTPPVADDPKPGKRPRSQSDVVCRDVTPVGTRFSKRVCTSRADWEERSRRDQEFIRTTRTAPTPNN